jgi:hypothetical protein
MTVGALKQFRFGIVSFFIMQKIFMGECPSLLL